jgi:hypothetical protein
LAILVETFCFGAIGMSATNSPNKSSQGTSNASKATSFENAIKEKSKIDACLDTLLKSIPDVPYILTVPSYELDIEPWKLRNEQNLCRQAYPFRTAELHHQYMSFLWRDSTDSCFEIRTEIDEERERKAREQKYKAINEVAAPSPLPTGGTKKKITLAAYKNKIAGGDKSQVASPEPSKLARNESMDIETQKVTKTDSRKSKATSDIPNMISDSAKRPEKRKAADSAPVRDKITPKKPRTNDSQDHLELPPMLSPLPSEQSALPPMLSPLEPEDGDSLLESPANGTNVFELPPLLSPTLPPALEEELQRIEKERLRAGSNASTSSDKASDKPNSTHVSPKDSFKSHPATSKTSIPDPDIYIKKEESKEDIKDIKDILSGKEPNQTENSQPSLIVKLKLSKRIRRDVERIWKLPVRKQLAPAISFSKPIPSKSIESPESQPRQPITKSKMSDQAAKRRALDSDVDRPSKKSKKRASDSAEDEASPPSDAATPQEPSPLMNKTKAPLTPKDTSTMARSVSNNSRLSTPRQITPLPSAKTADRIRKSSPVTPAKAKEAQELSTWSRKFNELGRQLKHEAQAIQNSSASTSQPTSNAGATNSEKLKALKNLDCIMSYMLAYAFNDARCRVLGRREDYEGTWVTLLPMLDVARNSARPVRILEALVCYLGYAVDRRIRDGMEYELDHNGESLSSADWHRKWRRLSKLQEKSRIRWSTAHNLLPMRLIRLEFPETYQKIWDQSDDNTDIDEPEDLLITMGLNSQCVMPGESFGTTPQAVRFGVALAKEWVEGQVAMDLEYELKVCGVASDEVMEK